MEIKRDGNKENDYEEKRLKFLFLHCDYYYYVIIDSLIITRHQGIQTVLLIDAILHSNIYYLLYHLYLMSLVSFAFMIFDMFLFIIFLSIY